MDSKFTVKSNLYKELDLTNVVRESQKILKRSRKARSTKPKKTRSKTNE